jgi:hypothetical protein
MTVIMFLHYQELEDYCLVGCNAVRNRFEPHFGEDFLVQFCQIERRIIVFVIMHEERTCGSERICLSEREVSQTGVGDILCPMHFPTSLMVSVIVKWKGSLCRLISGLGNRWTLFDQFCVRWGEHVARMGIRGMHTGFWWESQKERPLGRLRCGWEDIKMDVMEMGRGNDLD